MARYGLTQGSRVALLGVVAFIALAGLLYRRQVTRSVMALHFPPLYENIHEQEQQLPHYKEYESKDIKYFWAANHLYGLGWGNVMQDYVMMSLLAHATNRSFVFNDYTWNADGSWYSDFNGKLIPSRIPLSAIISGPVVGGELPPEDHTPRAVSKDFFQTICPNPTILQVSEINDDYLRYDETVSAAVIFDKWVQKLNSIDDPCVQLDANNGQIFDYWIYGQKKRLLPMWPDLSESPMIKRWSWSPLIHDAYESNLHLFHLYAPPPSSELLVLDETNDTTSKEDYSQPIPGLLALHVRRGDFEPHCRKLSSIKADWNAYNSFPEFLDHFTPPEDGDHLDLYMSHCYPSIAQIVAKVKKVRLESKEPLTHLYIMTNGAMAWVEELKTALSTDGEWNHISSSRDLKLTWEQKFVAQALDMFVAQRAQVLIGNGWSSLTSNVVMLRMVNGIPSDTNRFW
ncbi:hypothetical protein BV22DRAFT_1107628 [Leucogyrophana mollusca]|uniref:Uncharacterized protein n=1 Tax=Leucogyrophana mollusca TaxID=85980 RepID=A0ACB8B4P0_9AGAM|nr:hypothetical protein BV22DRAFT_1107628 [Leucogyrophana mollusca]